MRKSSCPITPNLFNSPAKLKFLVWNYVKEKQITKICIFAAWCWTYSANWELVTMIFFSRDSSCLYVWVNHIFVTVNSDDLSKMKIVSGAEVYTTNFFRSLPCFKWKLRKTWFLLKRMDCNESWKSLSPQLLFRVSLSRFYFVSALQHLDNRYAVKQTSSLYLKLSLVPPFFSCFFFVVVVVVAFWKGKSC